MEALKQLHDKRRLARWKVTIPNLRYVLQGGLFPLIVVGFIVFAAYYTILLQNISETFPIRFVMMVVLLPFVARCSFRTDIQQADSLHLLPLEPRMTTYLRSSWFVAALLSSVILMMMTLLVWPMYAYLVKDINYLLALIVITTLIHLVCCYGRWQEIRMVYVPARRIAVAARLCVSGLTVAAWVWASDGYAIIFIAAVLALYVIALSLPRKLIMPWEELLEHERKQNRKLALLWLTVMDLPDEPDRIFPRTLLTKLAKSLPLHQKSAFGFLIMKMFLRSELFGMLLRLTLIGMLIIGVIPSWIVQVVLYGCMMGILAVQFMAVRQWGAETSGLALDVVPRAWRIEALVQLIFRSLSVCAGGLWLGILFGAGEWTYPWLKFVLLAFVVIVLYFWSHYGLRKKWITKDE